MKYQNLGQNKHHHLTAVKQLHDKYSLTQLNPVFALMLFTVHLSVIYAQLAKKFVHVKCDYYGLHCQETARLRAALV